MPRFRSFLRRGLLLSATAAAVTYGVLAWRYWSNPPRLARNFAAELNVRVENFGYDQRAWPVYREALIELQQDSPEAWRSAVGARQILADPEAVKYLRSRQAALARMREASRLPALGYLLSDVTSPADRRLTDCLQPAAVRAQRAAAEIRS